MGYFYETEKGSMPLMGLPYFLTLENTFAYYKGEKNIAIVFRTLSGRKGQAGSVLGRITYSIPYCSFMGFTDFSPCAPSSVSFLRYPASLAIHKGSNNEPCYYELYL